MEVGSVNPGSRNTKLKCNTNHILLGFMSFSLAKMVNSCTSMWWFLFFVARGTWLLEFLSHLLCHILALQFYYPPMVIRLRNAHCIPPYHQKKQQSTSCRPCFELFPSAQKVEDSHHFSTARRCR